VESRPSARIGLESRRSGRQPLFRRSATRSFCLADPRLTLWALFLRLLAAAREVNRHKPPYLRYSSCACLSRVCESATEASFGAVRRGEESFSGENR
jgi:hypothetical protein